MFQFYIVTHVYGYLRFTGTATRTVRKQNAILCLFQGPRKPLLIVTNYYATVSKVVNFRRSLDNPIWEYLDLDIGSCVWPYCTHNIQFSLT